MQSIPVDVARLGIVMCVVPPEPRVNRDTGEVRKDREGNPTWTVGLAVRQKDGRRADVIDVTVSGEPAVISEGARVDVVDLVATSWEIDGRKGTSFRAAAVHVAGAAPAARGKAAGGDRA
ncbi:SCO3933 family regulatory protein [Streptomyces odontomachi]|uniref:SCO3933 family regulatory protein n=1 Tax=Streptomyces odontomachi TaxID=2944940 RepID=UPI00210A8E3B|nr:hypothetical protein [Streptomyces sp. ODS25]